MRKMLISSLAIAFQLCAIPAYADSEGPTVESRTNMFVAGSPWTMESLRKAANGKPECTEIWSFSGDGVQTVVSGEQTSRSTWYIDERDGNLVMIKTPLSTDTNPDCMGNINDPETYADGKERTMWMLFFRNGTGYACAAPAKMKDPETGEENEYWGDNCWGWLKPASPVDSLEPLNPMVVTQE